MTTGKSNACIVLACVTMGHVCLSALSSFVFSCSYLNAQNNPLAGDANISPKTSKHTVVLAQQLWFSIAARQYTGALQEFQAAFSNMQTINLKQSRA